MAETRYVLLDLSRNVSFQEAVQEYATRPSALPDLLAHLKLTDVTDRVRTAAEALYQELIKSIAPARSVRAPRQNTEDDHHDGWGPAVADPEVPVRAAFPSLLERRRRVGQALLAVVMGAYLQGVSTRKAHDLVEALGADSGISKSEGSRICQDLDAEIGVFNGRRLDD